MSSTLQASAVLDVGRLIDERPFGRYQWLIAAICAAIVGMDGFDAQSIGFVGPVLAADLGIARSAMGPLFSSSLLGMMVGSFAFGALADRVGRKPVLIACTLTFAVGSLLTARASTYQALLVLRAVTGLGLGGTIPNAIALTAEYAPGRIRAMTVMIMYCGVTLGAASGGFAAAALVEHFGWRSIFVVGGVLPCAAALLAAWALPESLRFLVLRQGPVKRIARIVNRLSPAATATATATATAYTVGEPHAQASPVRELFAAGRTFPTLLLWLIFFMNLLDLYLLNNWLPTIMTQNGISFRAAAMITALFQLGGTVGALSIGRSMKREASFTILALTNGGACLAVLALGSAGVLAAIAATIFVAGFCVVGGQLASNGVAADLYPTAIRSTGVGWAIGVGRIGSILGPVAGGWLLAAADFRHVFLAAALPPLLACGAAICAAVIVRRGRLRAR